MEEVYIISTARTPVGRRNGYLRQAFAPELLGFVLDEVVRRIDLDPELVQDVINGTVYQVGEQGFTLGRAGVLASRLPHTVPGISVNRQCGSSLSAIQMAGAMIASGVMDVVIASGCEIMSKYPIASDFGGTLPDGRDQGTPLGAYYARRVQGKLYNQAQAAQAIAEKWKVTKQQCDEYAVRSHQRAHHAATQGWFAEEIVPTSGLDPEGAEVVVDADETIRPDTTVQKLAGLKPVLGTEWITAGISSPVTDGASALVLASGRMVTKLGVEPLARLVASAVVGSDPVLMLTGPIDAAPAVLERASLSFEQIDVLEVNEAFAPIPLAFQEQFPETADKLNPLGGAIALGHPVGNSGSRLAITAIHQLRRTGQKRALVTLCTGGAMAPATIFERV